MGRGSLMAAAMLVATALASISAPAPAAGGTGTPHGVVLLYHHVSDGTPPSTSVSPAQFTGHLDFLATGGYRVWPLERLLDAVFRGAEEVPDNVVAITFDDAYESVFSEARPKLEARGWPYTVFVNTDAVDAGHSPYMDWDQIRTLHEAGVAIENHSAAHGHLSRPAEGESHEAWRSRAAADIERARSRIEDETGRAPTLFAYPYGEDSTALAEIVEAHHEYALAQRSGPVGPTGDPLSIPRFPMATGFSSLERLELAVRSRPLPVASADATADGSGSVGAIRFLELTIEDQGFRLDQLNCFAASGRRMDASVTRNDPIIVRVDVHGVGGPGRNKVNCTAPADDGSGDFFWYSFQWLVGRPASPE